MAENQLYISLIKEEIKKRGQIRLTIHGTSMIPTLYDGDIITIKLSDKYKIGDIIAYILISDNFFNIIIHRVVLVRSDYLLTKGDNNNFIDTRVLKKNILGLFVD